MKCVICKQGETEPETTTMVLDRNGTTILIRDIPAQVCTNCGEEYLDERTTEKVMKVSEGAAQSGVEVEIRHYVAA